MSGCNTRNGYIIPGVWEKHCGTRALLGFTVKVNGKEAGSVQAGSKED